MGQYFLLSHKGICLCYFVLIKFVLKSFVPACIFVQLSLVFFKGINSSRGSTELKLFRGEDYKNQITSDTIAAAFAEFVTSKACSCSKPENPKDDIKVIKFRTQFRLRYKLACYVETRRRYKKTLKGFDFQF